jgi:large repetitive protein
MNIISRISMLGLSAGLFLLTACNTLSVDALKPAEESPTILLRATTTTSAFASLDKILRTDQAKVVEIISQPARGIVSLYEGRLLYFQPHQSASVGQETFNITVGSNTFAVNLSLENNVACAPVAELDQFESKLNTATELNVLANDPIACSTNQVTLSVEIAPIGGIAQINNGKILYTPKQDFRGTDKFLYKVTENRSGAVAFASVLVSVGKETAAPCTFIVNEDYLQTPLNTEGNVNPAANDVLCLRDTGRIILKVITKPKHGTVRFENMGLSLFYKPNQDFIGADSLLLEVCNSAGKCQVNKVNIQVLPPKPGGGNPGTGPCNFIVQEDMLTAIINSESGINPLVNDDICVAPGNQIQLSIATPPQNGTTRFDNSGLSLFYKPNPNFVGQDVLELNVCRAPNDCKKSKVQITVLRR